MVVDEGEGDGDRHGDGIEVIDPPPPITPPTPSPSGFSKPRAPSQPPPARRGRSPGQPRCWSRAARGINQSFPPPRIAT